MRPPHQSRLRTRYQSAELVSCRAPRWLQTENCRPHLQHCAIPGMAWIVIELVHILLINNHTYNLTWHLQHLLNLVIQITFYFKWIILSNCTEHSHIIMKIVSFNENQNDFEIFSRRASRKYCQVSVSSAAQTSVTIVQYWNCNTERSYKFTKH